MILRQARIADAEQIAELHARSWQQTYRGILRDEKNVFARRFYERLGAAHVESICVEVPGGGSAIECRYTWRDLSVLVAATESRESLAEG